MTQTAAVCYRIDARQSRFQVRAYAGGMLSASGHNPAIREFTGEACFQPESLEDASLHLTFAAASMAVTSDIGDKDRLEIERTMQEQVLETPRYPEIRFDSSAITGSGTGEGQYRVKIDGNVNADTFRAFDIVARRKRE
jgi:polyisoprenoid-binding protein YceI